MNTRGNQSNLFTAKLADIGKDIAKMDRDIAGRDRTMEELLEDIESAVQRDRTMEELLEDIELRSKGKMISEDLESGVPRRRRRP